VNEDPQTEAQVVAELAHNAEAPTKVDPLNLYVYRGEVLDLDEHLEAPRRTKGTTRLFDDADVEFGAAWADHRAVLTLKATPEWTHWAGPNGQMLGQEAFAEHIETGADEVVKPSGAEMLELAQTFHAKNNVAFKQSTILASGERQFAYEETIAAKAGQTGKLTIPKEFELGIAPFEGTDKYKVIARLRYRIREGALTIGYKLDRPEVVQLAAFDDVASRIAAAADLTILSGLPPVGV